MKKAILSIAFILASVNVFAQQKTLFSSEGHNGWFLSPETKFSQVQGEFAVLCGFRGGWIIDKAVSLGFAGYGVGNPTELDGNPDYQIHMGYGGFELGIILKSDELVHLTARTLIGGGGFAVLENVDDWDDDNPDDEFFVFEPSLGLTLNVARNVRVEIGGSYRMATNVEHDILKNEDFSGFSGHIGLQFGKF